MSSSNPISTSRLPVLTKNKFFRYFSFIALYVAQGIPEGMTYFGIPAWMAMNGKSPAEIGAFVAVVGIPWSFKILLAPMMDRYTFLAMGRRRPWVLIGQTGLIGAFLAMSMVPDPLNNLSLLMTAGFFVSLFGALQDIATDGMAIDVVPVEQQARANGLMWGSKTMGISASLFIGNWLINNYGFSAAILSLLTGIVLIMLVPLFLRERPGEKLLPWTQGSASPDAAKMQMKSWSQILRSLFKVFFLPTSLIMGVAIFSSSIGIGLMEVILPVFSIQEAGWSDETFSRAFSVCSLTGGLAGMLAGGLLADRFGKVRMMTIYLVSLIVLVISMGLLKSYWVSPAVITSYILIYYILYVFLTISIFAIGMQLCWNRVAATQFTLYMAIANMGRATGAGLLGPLTAAFAWEYVIGSFAIFAFFSLVLIQLLRIQKHLVKVDIMESRHKDTDGMQGQVLLAD
jgi:PAT family beta-lactamase induction signal transducer AmpG